MQGFKSLDDFKARYPIDREHPFDYEAKQQVSATPEQDKAMQAKAFELFGKEISEAGIESDIKAFISDSISTGKPEKTEGYSDYGFLTNNCSQHVSEIAGAGDVYSNQSLIPNSQILMSVEDYTKYLQATTPAMAY